MNVQITKVQGYAWRLTRRCGWAELAGVIFRNAPVIRKYLLLSIVSGYNSMLASFGDKETERIYRGDVSRKFPFEIQRVARRKLIMLHSAVQVSDLKIPPGNKLEKLKGNLSDFHSIRINEKWRILFIWKSGKAQRVKIADYH